jgi:hypothetical protein
MRFERLLRVTAQASGPRCAEHARSDCCSTRAYATATSKRTRAYPHSRFLVASSGFSGTVCRGWALSGTSWSEGVCKLGMAIARPARAFKRRRAGSERAPKTLDYKSGEDLVRFRRRQVIADRCEPTAGKEFGSPAWTRTEDSKTLAPVVPHPRHSDCKALDGVVVYEVRNGLIRRVWLLN